MPRFLSVSLILIFLIFYSSANAQLSNYHMQHYTDEDGLPQNSIKGIVEGVDGFIWLATESGVVRYDGNKFALFSHTQAPLKSARIAGFFSNNYLKDPLQPFCAYSDKNDVIYIGQGKPILDSVNLTVRLKNDNFGKDFLNGDVLLSTGLLNQRYHISSQKKLLILESFTDGYVCGRDSVVYYKNNELQYRVKNTVENPITYFPYDSGLLFYSGKGLLKISANEKYPIRLKGDAEEAFYKTDSSVKNFIWNNGAKQLFLNIESDWYYVTKRTNNEILTKKILSGFNGVSNNIVTVYYNTHTSKIYLGSVNKGLYIFRPMLFRVLGIGHEKNYNIYYGQYRWNDSTVITAQGHLLSRNEQKVLPLLNKSAGTDFFTMFIAKDKTIWTKHSDCVWQFNETGTALLQTFQFDEDISLITKNNDGDIWIATKKGSIFQYNDKTRQMCRMAHLKEKVEINCIQEDKDKWLIGTSEGFYYLHKSGLSIEKLKAFNNVNVRSIYLDKDDNSWVATYNAGIFLIKDGNVHTLPKDKLNSINTTHCIVEDRFGFLWMTTNKGMFRALKHELISYADKKISRVYYYKYTKEHGFYTNEFNGGCQPCSVVLEDGTISFPSLNGMVWISPDSISPTAKEKAIYIDKITIDGEPLKYSDTILLNTEFNLIDIMCATPQLENAQSTYLEYAWVKNGDKPVWVPMKEDNVISQSTLLHGFYNLRIRRLNEPGLEKFTEKNLYFIVKPKFINTPGFYILLLLMLSLIGWAYYRFRLQYVRHKNAQLSRKVKEHTKEIHKAMMALSLSEQNMRKQMQVREIIMTSISHDIGSPLKYINMVAEQVKTDIDENNISTNTHKYIDNLYNSSYYIYHLSRNLLQYLRLSAQNQTMTFEEFDLNDLVEKKTAIFDFIGREKETKVINNVPEACMIFSVKLLVEVVVHNLLDNAVKVTRQNNVYLNYKEEVHAKILTIKDSGAGMHPDIVAHYNAPKKSIEEEEAFRLEYPGFGLGIVRDLLALIDARLYIESDTSGTAISIIFNEEEIVL